MTDKFKQEMFKTGLCGQCAAYRGRKGKEVCRAMSPGCPAPDYMKLKVMNKEDLANLKKCFEN